MGAARKRQAGSMTDGTATRRRFLDCGMELLAENGPAGIRTAALARQAHRTTGSFYHHFGSLEDFVTELIDHWRTLNTRRIIDSVTLIDEAHAQRIALTSLVASIDYRVELAMRAWAADNENVRKALAEVDEMRLSFIQRLIARLDHRQDMAVDELALIEYAAFIGFQYLFSRRSTDERRRVIARLTELITPGAAHNV